MSIREDAKNDRIIRELIGYDPQERIAHLVREKKALETEVRRLQGLLRTRLLNEGKCNGRS